MDHQCAGEITRRKCRPSDGRGPEAGAAVLNFPSFIKSSHHGVYTTGCVEKESFYSPQVQTSKMKISRLLCLEEEEEGGPDNIAGPAWFMAYGGVHFFFRAKN